MRVGGTSVDVESKPLDVLRYLLSHAGEAVTKDELLDAVWPGVTVVDGSLATAMSKLRRALGADGDAIVTLARVGYRLSATVYRTGSVAAAPADLQLTAGESVPRRPGWVLARRLSQAPGSEVWLAEHPKTREQRVFKFAASTERLRSLKREVTLARLLRETLGEREEFVRLLEWDFSATPYFTESAFGGPNLNEWCDARGGLAAVPLGERLDLVTAVAVAVGAAHSLDVLHKDLKPSNILVAPGTDDAPRIKVADFGSASLLTPERLAALGITNLGFTLSSEHGSRDLLGSVMYVAPELLLGQSPTPASDVYALGVLLYQMVVGDFRKPLAPGWEDDVEDPLLRDDIAASAAGDPTRRLSTAEALSARLRSLDERRAARERTREEEGAIPTLPPPTPGRPNAQPRVGLVAAALVVLVAAASSAALWRRSSEVPASVLAPPAAPIASLAVLPLENLSGDPAQDYLADGLTEALIADLSGIRALRVISRTTMMAYKQSGKAVPQIGRELGVDGVIEGTVARSGDRVRLTAQLVLASTDATVWTNSYDGDVRDLLNLQRALARQVTQEIRVTIQPAETRQLAASSVDARAYDLYLRGRFFWNRRTRDDLLKAREYFEQAVIADPTYALAHAGLADTYVELVGFGNLAPAEGLPKAKAAAEQSIAIDPSLAEGHNALGYAHATGWDWSRADAEFRQALALNPGYVVAMYQYGFFLSLMGHQDEAIPLVERALASDPLSSIVRYRAGRVYYQARQFGKAHEQFAKILELNPADPLGIYGHGLVYAAEGNFERASEYLGRQQLQRGFDAAAAIAAAGRTVEARRLLAEGIRRHQAANDYLRPGWVAEVYASLGDRADAMNWLERGFAERDAWLVLIKVWPPFDSLREEPRFQALLARMNFPR